MSRTWIVYKAVEPDAPGWEERQLLPIGGLVDTLAEEWDSSGQDFPQIGDRLRDYGNPSEPGDGATHGQDSDWVVTEVHRFTSPTSDLNILLCYCAYQACRSDWQPLRRGKPVDELLAVASK
jgi:hypothetical protein